jgi:hypothetical protein
MNQLITKILCLFLFVYCFVLVFDGDEEISKTAREMIFCHTLPIYLFSLPHSTPNASPMRTSTKDTSAARWFLGYG